jgi:hypothetical protein
MVISADLCTVQTTAEEVREKLAEDADKLRRKNNIIIYNAPESKLHSNLERVKDDKDYCIEMMSTVLKVGYEEDDIKKVLRLGKKGDDSRARSLLVEFSDGHIKNMVMENASRLEKAQGKFEHVTISHNMTAKERDQCRKLVAEAKHKQSEDESGEYIYKVRGPPAQMKIMKFKKNYQKYRKASVY